MEAAVCNLLSANDKVLIIEGGKFGERWTEICKAYGVLPKVIKVEWGKSASLEQIQKILQGEKDIKAVYATLVETSTGVTFDVKAIGEMVKKTNTVLVVDAISGLGATDLPTDAWGVDVVVSGSQKGLMLPPGLAFISLSVKAYNLMAKAKLPRYYFDLQMAKKAFEKTDTPFTPAIGIIIALSESLKIIKTQTLQKLFTHFAKLAKATQAAAKALGLELYAHPSCASNVVTAIKVPVHIDGEKLVKTMRDTYGIAIAGGQGEELKGKIIRIAHMGCINENDTLTGISFLEKVLEEMGYKFKLGTGVAAAEKVLNS